MIALGLGLFALEVVLVLTQCVVRIQESIIRERDDGRVADAEVNTSHVLTGWVSVDVVLADHVQFPPLLVRVPDGSDLLDGFQLNLGRCFVLAKDEVESIFVIGSFTESELFVLVVVANAV